METNFIPFNLAVLCFLLINVYGGNNLMETNRKEMLEIGIGGGGGGGGGSSGVGTNCTPPPPSPPPPTYPPPVYSPRPPPPPLPRAPPLQQPSKPPPSLQPFYVQSRIIQRLRGDVIDDPNHITETWKGGNVCKYKGFLCTPSPRNKSRRIVSSFNINGQNIKFKSLRYLGGLKDLMIIHVNSNRFMGTIPESISKLRYLYELDVSNNLLSGPFPIYVTKMPQLIFLDIRFNHFAGFVPPELFFIGHKVLFLNNNNFTKQIPDTLGSSPVAYLTFANNRFIGGIPRTIRNMSETLFEVLFLNNNLSGCLPYEIGFLKEATIFDAGFNQLTGPIPDSFGCLRLMELLNFAGNLLYGQIPEVVCALSKLTNLSLSDNYFNAAGPLCKRLAKKGLLDDRKNCIPGRPKQRLPKECDEFYSKPKHCLSEPSYIPCQLPRFSRPLPLAVHATPPPSYPALSPFYIKSKPGA